MYAKTAADQKEVNGAIDAFGSVRRAQGVAVATVDALQKSGEKTTWNPPFGWCEKNPVFFMGYFLPTSTGDGLAGFQGPINSRK